MLSCCFMLTLMRALRYDADADGYFDMRAYALLLCCCREKRAAFREHARCYVDALAAIDTRFCAADACRCRCAIYAMPARLLLIFFDFHFHFRHFRHADAAAYAVS